MFMSKFKAVVIVLGIACFSSASPVPSDGVVTDPLSPNRPGKERFPVEKNVIVHASPIGFLFGSANAALELKLGTRVSLGPYLSYAAITANSTTAQALGYGLGGTAYLSGPALTDGWMLNTGVFYTSLKAGSKNIEGMSIAGNFGYWWFWESGFNLGLGLGLQYLAVDLKKVGLFDVSGVIPSALIRIGYAF